MIEVDTQRDTKTVIRLEFDPLIAVHDVNGIFYADKALQSRLLLDPRRLHQKHERASGAVHNRHFTCREIDI